MASPSDLAPPPAPQAIAADHPSSLDAADPIAAKKPAWKRPEPNGAVEVGPTVMDAVSWPALSEAAAKASPKSAFVDSVKPLSDGSAPASAGAANPPYSPKMSSNSTGPGPVAHNLSLVNHAPPSRQRSMKRGGGNGGDNVSVGGGNSGVLSNGVDTLLPTLQAAAASQGAPVNPERHGGPQVSPREHSARNAGGWERPRGGGGNESHRGYGGNRRGGGGDRHNNYGNRWDQERGGYDGYHNRGFGNRDGHMQQRGSRPFVRAHPQPGPTAPIFGPAPAVRPYVNPTMVYSELASPMYYIATQPLATQPPSDTFRPVSLIPYPVSPPPLPPPMYAVDHLRDAILKQIEYYFSPENLCKDTYLRDHMDEHGWVPISFVAGFNKVRQLTDNVGLILETVRFSATLEVQGEKVRVRNDWMKWVLPSNGNQLTAGSAHQAPATPALDGQADGL